MSISLTTDASALASAASSFSAARRIETVFAACAFFLPDRFAVVRFFAVVRLTVARFTVFFRAAFLTACLVVFLFVSLIY